MNKKQRDELLTQQERSKYERMAAHGGYHGCAGLPYVQDAILQLPIPRGSKLWDFGAGSGECILAFREAGIEASGFDITKDRTIPEAKPHIRLTTL